MDSFGIHAISFYDRVRLIIVVVFKAKIIHP